MTSDPTDHEAVLARLAAYRAHDAPTHGGRVLSYVYDSGLAALDELAARAAREVQSVNGLDPTAFPSVALLEGDLVAFGREILHGPDAIGSVTSGGTESCLLAVKAARDVWAARPDAAPPGTRPTIVLPSTAHAAFHKAAHYLGLDLDVVPVDPTTGTLPASALTARFDTATALVVVSAPAYPHGVPDPVAEVAAAAVRAGIPCHVDACIGGLVLPFWEAAGGAPVPAWDFRVPGVTSISADLHKYGYAPKGASLLLFADRALDRARYFALTDWPGYPVVNPTVLGSRSATSLAAAWAVTTALGTQGYVELTRRVQAATAAVRTVLSGLRGLRVLGDPVGPLLAVVSDDSVDPANRVDPHLWAAAVGARGFVLQGQPALAQSDGSTLPRSTHLTVTPVTEGLLTELTDALVAGADEVRGRASGRADGSGAAGPAQGVPDPAELARAAREEGELDLTAVLALIEALPREQSARMLVEFLASFTEPQTATGSAAEDYPARVSDTGPADGYDDGLTAPDASGATDTPGAADDPQDAAVHAALAEASGWVGGQDRVSAVGLGATDAGDPCVLVYAGTPAPELPTQLHGIPVRVVTSDPVLALDEDEPPAAGRPVPPTD
ncbi:pyridoxal phosphate-dependent decarboxylase family protein [Ornithinicoccus hortensis]|uniref:Glutamate/tyrosine decarboxylase-like PLP-dependent enzyme n=1 Tax=Ornithinicoccus hortensis TaxID=82346 RepID=A0A542YM16_9MICO|nr:aminotransferase class V-fold PLP-dependent enzyme [Ornithinicoccus hortensis]TQL49128.1 glutamate/tyrosine decarboxylase-like PLP-dependent enzyme [Ornithinicoccus hortensis]